MSAQKLPAEVWIQIFRELDNKQSVQTCMSVGETWQLAASQIFHEKITLTAYTIYIVKQHLTKAKLDRDEFFRHGIMTKKLAIRYDSVRELESDDRFSKYKAEKESRSKESEVTHGEMDVQFSKEEFLLLISYMPNIKKIDFHNCEHIDFYLKLLRDLNPNNYLLQLEEIGFDWRGDKNLHFSAMYNFHRTLSHLIVRDSGKNYTLNGQTKTECGFLPDFKNITHLILSNGADPDLTIIDVLKICTGLTDFQFHTEFPIPDDKVKGALTLMDEQARKSNSVTEMDVSSPAYFNRNLKAMDISLKALTASYIKYFVKYLPDHLDTLLFKFLYGMDFYHWIDEVGMDTALEFARRLGAFNNAHISCSPNREYHRIAGAESKITTYFRLLGAMRGDRKLYTVACFFEHGDLLMTVNDNHNMVLSYVLDDTDYLPNNDHNDERAPPFQLPLPDKNKTNIGFEVINDLSLYSDRLEKEFPFQALKYALTNCPNLQLFEVQCVHTNKKIRASHIGNWHRWVRDCDPSGTSQEFLKRIKLEGVDLLSNKLLGLLSTHLPNIGYLVCVGSQYYTDNGDDADDDDLNLNMTFDMTGFKSLEIFCLDIQTMASGESDHCFIHFKYADSGEEEYYHIGAPKEDEKNFAFTPTTLDRMKECRETHIGCSLVSFKCNKTINEIVISGGQDVIAYIVDRQPQVVDSDDYGFYKKFFY